MAVYAARVETPTAETIAFDKQMLLDLNMRHRNWEKRKGIAFVFSALKKQMMAFDGNANNANEIRTINNQTQPAMKTALCSLDIQMLIVKYL